MRWYHVQRTHRHQPVHNTLDTPNTHTQASNILVGHSGHVYLADFSIARMLPTIPSTLHTCNETTSDDSSTAEDAPPQPPCFAGSICWMAPEVIEGAGCDEKADMWSFGMTLLELLHGNCPGWDKPARHVLIQRLHGAVEDTLLPETLDVSRALRDVLERCLCKDPEQRVGAARLLEHKFWTKVVVNVNNIDIVYAPMRPHCTIPSLHQAINTPQHRRHRAPPLSHASSSLPSPGVAVIWGW